MTAATAPVAAPQKTTTQRDGASEPRCDSVPITTDAASAPETKKIATRSITMIDVISVNGRSASTLKVCASGPPSATGTPERAKSIAVPPKIENQSTLTTLGTSS